MSTLKSCLPPIVRADTRLLICGSLPGEASLSAARYYAHPRNQFWRLLAQVLGEKLELLAYPDRLERLLERGVGVWDVVARAERRGSLDAAIRDAEANDLGALAASLPALRAVAFNGKTAARIGRQALRSTPLDLIDLPSSSPALTLSFAAKLTHWRALAAHLA